MFKYNVKYFLEQKTIAESRICRNLLLERLKISNGRLSQLLNLKVEDTGDWSGEQLKIAAEILGCSVDDFLRTNKFAA